MRRNISVRPSKSGSFFGFIMGLVFVGIGIFTVIPTFGAFGFLWTGFAIVITAMNGINAFGKKGVPTHEIEITSNIGETFSKENSEMNFEEKLRRLKSLKDDGIITQEEYERKKNDILNDKW